MSNSFKNPPNHARKLKMLPKGRPSAKLDMSMIDGTIDGFRRSQLMQDAIHQNARTGEILASALAITHRSTFASIPSLQLSDLLRRPFPNTAERRNATNSEIDAPSHGLSNVSSFKSRTPGHFADSLLERMSIQTEQRGTRVRDGLASALGLTTSVPEARMAGPRRLPDLLDRVLALTEQQSATAGEILTSALSLSTKMSVMTPIRLRRLSDLLRSILAQIDLQSARFGDILVSVLTVTNNTPGLITPRPRHLLELLEGVLQQIERQSTKTGEFLAIALALSKSIVTVAQRPVPDLLEEILEQTEKLISDTGETLITALGLTKQLLTCTHPPSTLHVPRPASCRDNALDYLRFADLSERTARSSTSSAEETMHGLHFGSKTPSFVDQLAFLREQKMLFEEHERELLRRRHRRHRFMSNRTSSTMIRKTATGKIGVRREKPQEAAETGTHDETSQPKRKRQRQVDLTRESTADDCRSGELNSSSESEPAMSKQVTDDTCKSPRKSLSPPGEMEPDEKRLKQN